MNRPERIASQLGMSQGAANNKLRKNILFYYVGKAENSVLCHVCLTEIESVDDFSIEHIKPWEGRDAELFWDLDNIAFSHVQCNKQHKTATGPRDVKRRNLREGYSWCCGCKMELPFEDFWRNSSTMNGYQMNCKSCHTKAKK